MAAPGGRAAARATGGGRGDGPGTALCCPTPRPPYGRANGRELASNAAATPEPPRLLHRQAIHGPCHGKQTRATDGRCRPRPGDAPRAFGDGETPPPRLPWATRWEADGWPSLPPDSRNICRNREEPIPRS